jgi:hypothetical protein
MAEFGEGRFVGGSHCAGKQIAVTAALRLCRESTHMWMTQMAIA